MRAEPTKKAFVKRRGTLKKSAMLFCQPQEGLNRPGEPPSHHEELIKKGMIKHQARLQKCKAMGIYRDHGGWMSWAWLWFASK